VANTDKQTAKEEFRADLERISAIIFSEKKTATFDPVKIVGNKLILILCRT